MTTSIAAEATARLSGQRQRSPDAFPPAVPGTAGRHGWARTDCEHLGPLLVELAALDADDPRFAGLRAELIVGYLPVVRHLARRYARRGRSIEDLEQVATVGLINALDRFDPDRGSEFLSYLIPTATGELLRYFRDSTWALRVPRRLSDLHGAINRALDPLSQDLGRAPRPAEIAAYLCVDVGDVVEALDAAQAYHTVSLDDVLGDSDTTRSELLGRADAALNLVEVRHTLGMLLARLPERERKILTLRFFGGLTQAQIGDAVGLSQMHVSRLLTATLTGLRTALQAPCQQPTANTRRAHALRTG